jgi:hypothetical protein
MLYYWLIFFFVAFGAKVLLAFLMMYLLLPADRRCGRCDGETLLIRANRAARFGFALSRRHVEWRWCLACGWEGLGRRSHLPLEPAVRRADSPISKPH